MSRRAGRVPGAGSAGGGQSSGRQSDHCPSDHRRRVSGGVRSRGRVDGNARSTPRVRSISPRCDSTLKPSCPLGFRAISSVIRQCSATTRRDVRRSRRVPTPTPSTASRSSPETTPGARRRELARSPRSPVRPPTVGITHCRCSTELGARRGHQRAVVSAWICCRWRFSRTPHMHSLVRPTPPSRLREGHPYSIKIGTHDETYALRQVRLTFSPTGSNSEPAG